MVAITVQNFVHTFLVSVRGDRERKIRYANQSQSRQRHISGTSVEHRLNKRTVVEILIAVRAVFSKQIKLTIQTWYKNLEVHARESKRMKTAHLHTLYLLLLLCLT